MYIAVRGDLPPGLQMAQAVHAAFEFSEAHPEITSHWVKTSNYLVVVSVSDEETLLNVATKAVESGIALKVVNEPDLDGNPATAVALEPGHSARKICSSYPLALREKVGIG